MFINQELQAQLKAILPKDYRKQVVERLTAKGIDVHPNTVKNVLHGHSQNPEVLTELINLGHERKQLYRELEAKKKEIMKIMLP